LKGIGTCSKIELRSGYHQLCIKEDDKPQKAFRTQYEHYKYVVMPFGLANALTTFMDLMSKVFNLIWTNL